MVGETVRNGEAEEKDGVAKHVPQYPEGLSLYPVPERFTQLSLGDRVFCPSILLLTCPSPLPQPGLSLWEDSCVRFYLAHGSVGSSPSGAALLLWAPGGVCGSYGGEPMVWETVHHTREKLKRKMGRPSMCPNILRVSLDPATKRLPHLSLGDQVSHIWIFGDDDPTLTLLPCCGQKE